MNLMLRLKHRLTRSTLNSNASIFDRLRTSTSCGSDRSRGFASFIVVLLALVFFQAQIASPLQHSHHITMGHSVEQQAKSCAACDVLHTSLDVSPSPIAFSDVHDYAIACELAVVERALLSIAHFPTGDRAPPASLASTISA